MRERTKINQVMARQLVEMRAGDIGEELAAELDRELENEDGDGNGGNEMEHVSSNEKITRLRLCHDKAEARCSGSIE